MKVYRGIRSEYQDDFSRDYSKSSYLNCFSFWAPSKEYAEEFGPIIMERDINPSKFFDSKCFGRFHPLGWNSKKPKSNF